MRRSILSLPKGFTLLVLLAAGAALVPAAARAQAALDLARFDRMLSAEPTVEMDLRGALLGALRRSVATDDPEMASVLAGVRGMQMRVYELTDAADGRRALDGVTALGRSLRAEGWESFLRVRDDGDYVDMLTRPEGGADGVLGGFVMLVVSPEATETSVVLLNFVGRVDPEQAARVGRRLSDERTGRTPRPRGD